jgi:WD40 repeat protein/tRNA A-37 threonylcarbamoyl transferase component Bud32
MSDAPQPHERADTPESELLAERQRRVEALADDYLEGLIGDRTPDRHALLAAHPDLAELLEPRLALVELIHRVARARHPAAGETVRLTTPAAPAERVLRVKCPHCGNGIELVEPDPGEVTCGGCGSSFHIDVRATTSFDPAALPRWVGKFQVLEQLGRGAFGTVYKARDLELERLVAVKVPRAGSFATPAEEERFLREARAAAQLSHPGIVPVLEIAHDRGVPYIVSEYVEGLTLADVLTARRPGFREAAELVAAVADALEYAHRQKIVHRDVKPSNLLLDGAGRPRVTDFGLARRGEGEITVTLDGQILGTPAYMSPEQAAGEQQRVDTRNDVYSLGVVLYELLTGELPFRGNQRMLLHQVLHDEPRPPRSLNDRVPRDLETVCLKAMAKAPGRRYASAANMADDLRRWLNGEPVRARPVGRGERVARWARRHPAAAALVGVSGLALLALVAAAVGLFYNSRLQGALAEAEEQRGRAEQLKAEAEEQRGRAEQLKAEAEGQRRRADRYLYASDMNLAHAAWQDNQLTRMVDLLARHESKRITTEDHRGFEWHYLWRLCHSDLRTLRAPSQRLTSVCFGPDGRRVAANGLQGTVKVWDVRTGEECLSLSGHSFEGGCVCFSRDGRWLASGGSMGALRVWDAQEGKELFRLKGHVGEVRGVSFSPDGRWLVSASADYEVGRQMAGQSENTLRVWDMQTGQAHRCLSGHTAGVKAVCYSPDGRWLASGSDDRTIKVWDARTWLEHLTLKGHDAAVWCVSYGPDGEQLASGDGEGTVRVWDTRTGQQRLAFVHAAGRVVYGVCFSPDGGQIASGCWDNTVKVWDARTGQERAVLRGHQAPVAGVSFSPDGRVLASASWDQTVKLWDPSSNQECVILKGHTAQAMTVAFSPRGRLLASGGLDGTVRLWDPQTGEQRRCLAGGGHGIEGVCFSPDGRRLASVGEAVRVWDVETGQEVLTFNAARHLMSICFSPDGLRLATADAEGVNLWDAQNGQKVLTLKGPRPGLSGAVCFSPDGELLASAGRDYDVRVWDVRTGKEVHTLKGHPGQVNTVCFSPDGRSLVSGGVGVKVWDVRTGQETLALKGHGSQVWGVCFSPDGRRIATADWSTRLKLWDAETGQEILTVRGHADRDKSICFSPDGRWIAASGGRDNSVRVWDAEEVTPAAREARVRALVEPAPRLP